MGERRSRRRSQARVGQDSGIGPGVFIVVGLMGIAVLVLSFLLFQEKSKDRKADSSGIVARTKDGGEGKVNTQGEARSPAQQIKKASAKISGKKKVKFEDLVEDRAVELAHERLDRAGYPAHARTKAVIEGALPSCRKMARVQVKMWRDTMQMGKDMGASDYQVEKAIGMMNSLSAGYIEKKDGVPEEIIKMCLKRSMKSLKDRRGRK